MALARNVDALFALPHAGALWAVGDCFVPVQRDVYHPDLWALSRVAVIHYVDDKPWAEPDPEDNKPYQEEVQ